MGVFARSWLGALLVALVAAGCTHYEAKPLVPADTAAELEQRSLASDGLRRFVEEQVGHTLSEWPPRSWDVQTLTLAAFYFQPSLQVARAEWNSAKAAEITAGERPNPTLAVTPQYAFNADKGVSPWLAIVDLDIPLETAGKRGHRLEQARYTSESARLRVAQAAWQVRRKVRSALLSFGALRDRQRLLAQRLDVHEQIAAILQRRLDLGAIERMELSSARIDRDRAQLELDTVNRELADARVAIAEAIGVPLLTLSDIPIGDVSGDVANIDVDQLEPALRRAALTGRADVLAVLAEYAAAQSALQLEIAKQYPDVHLGTGYEYDQGEHKWALGLTAEIPVLSRNEGGIAEAEAKRADLRARFLELQASIIAELDHALEAIRATREQRTGAQRLLNAQRRQYEAVGRQFRAGATDRLDVTNARLALIRDEEGLLDGETMLREATAQLEDALQRPLDAVDIAPRQGGQRTE